MKPAILLTGKNGQVGHELERTLPQVGAVTALGRQELDLTKPEEIRRALRTVRPQIVVNAAAYTAVDKAESEPTVARQINSDAVAVLAEEARKVGAAIIHYSTDYVFDGSKPSPYAEEDETSPLGVYGKTKLDGEQALQGAGVPYLIFRTAWVYGRHGRNFLRTILRLACEKEELRVVRDQLGAPTWSAEIAAATTAILRELLDGGSFSIGDLGGIYHMSAAGETNWHEFARAILDEAARSQPAPWITEATGGRPFTARRVVPITTAEYLTPARRPAYSVLSNARLNRTFGIQLAEWRVALHSVFSVTGLQTP